ncbi:GNAT family N-acetyltransferase [Planctomycetota bacterium]
MSAEFTVGRASPGDQDAILAVMEHWNMHHVPSAEMEEIDLEAFFVARIAGRIVGAAGYKVVSQSVGKTTLLGVLPELSGKGIGKMLHERRLEAMHRLGVATVVTNADRPATIAWYKRRFGYREIGTLKKVCSFGDPSVDRWTTLELDLRAYFRKVDQQTALRDYVARNEPHPLAPYPPLLINVCLTGMIPVKEQTPFVPVTPEEIVADAVCVYEAGARVVHIHARDEEGRPTWRGEVYETILTGIRRECPDLVCCVSTSGRNWPDFERRSEVLQLEGLARPDMASLTLGSLNFPSGPSVSSPDMIRRLAALMAEKGIRPELEVFDPGMVGFAKYLERKGLIGGRKYFNILLGNLGTAPATMASLVSMVEALPEESTWAAAGIGVFQLPMNVAAIVAGGGVRVGIEDAIYYDYGRTRPASNEEAVRRLARIAAELQRPLATSAEARRMVGLS